MAPCCAPGVVLPAVRVVGIIRTPADLTENPDAPTDVTFTGTGSIYVTAAFYHRFAASVASRQDSRSISSAARQAWRPSKPR